MRKKLQLDRQAGRLWLRAFLQSIDIYDFYWKMQIPASSWRGHNAAAGAGWPARPSTDLSTVSAAATGSSEVLKIAVDCPLRALLDYLPPPGRAASSVRPGTRVRVPMGRRETVGVVVDSAAQSELADTRLRRVSELLDEEPLLDTALLELLTWTASYYHHPPGRTP